MCIDAETQRLRSEFRHLHPARSRNHICHGLLGSGKNVVAGGASDAEASPSRIYADAPGVIGSGNDLCKSIQNACGLLVGNQGGIVDAAGMVSFNVGNTLQCTVNPFSGCPSGTTIYLPATLIQTTVQWVTPAAEEIRLFGMGDIANVSSGGTAIQAISPFPTSGCSIGTVSISTCPIIVIGNASQDLFATEIANLTLDANSLNNATGIASIEMQDRSWIHDISIINIGNISTGGKSMGAYFDATLKTGGSGTANFDIDRLSVRTVSSPSQTAGAVYGLFFKGGGGKPIGRWNEINLKSGCSTCTTSNELPIGLYLDGTSGGGLTKGHCETTGTCLKYGDTASTNGLSAQIEGDTTSVVTMLDLSTSATSGTFFITPTGGTISVTNCAILDRTFSSSCLLPDNFNSSGTFNYQCCGKNASVAANMPSLVIKQFGSSNSINSTSLVSLFSPTSSWVLPQSTSWRFDCSLFWQQNTNVRTISFGVQANNTAPVELDAQQQIVTSTSSSSVTPGTIVGRSTTTATALPSVTPGAHDQPYQGTFHGMFETGSGGTTTFRILGETSNATNATLQINSGSICTLDPVD